MGRPRRTDSSGRNRRRRRLQHVLLLAMAPLYALSIPWYRSSDEPLRLVAGLPDWVAVATVCYALIAVLNAVAWMLSDFEDPPPTSGADTP